MKRFWIVLLLAVVLGLSGCQAGQRLVKTSAQPIPVGPEGRSV